VRRSEGRTHLGREEFRLFPRREVSCLSSRFDIELLRRRRELDAKFFQPLLGAVPHVDLSEVFASTVRTRRASRAYFLL